MRDSNGPERICDLTVDRLHVINLLGGRCARCGFNDIRALQIDHVKGGGTKERRKWKGRNYYNMILALSDEERRERYQLLCANCNTIKAYERMENLQAQFNELLAKANISRRPGESISQACERVLTSIRGE